MSLIHWVVNSVRFILQCIHDSLYTNRFVCSTQQLALVPNSLTAFSTGANAAAGDPKGLPGAALARRGQLLIRFYVDCSTSVEGYQRFLQIYFQDILVQVEAAWTQAGNSPGSILVSQVAFNSKRKEIQDYTPIQTCFRWSSQDGDNTYLKYRAKGTTLYDSVVGGANRGQLVAKQYVASGPVTSVVVFITDGFDNGSTATEADAAEAVAAARQKGVNVIYVYLGHEQAQATMVSEGLGVGPQGTIVDTADIGGLKRTASRIAGTIINSEGFRGE